MNEDDWLAGSFEANRGHLEAVAYRMLGSRSEAEDAVQEAWLRLSRTERDDIDNLGGWLTTVVARICLDMLRARRSRREDSLDAGEPQPAAFVVLLARLRALLRRGAPQRPTVLTAGTLRLDPARRVVERDAKPIELTPREYGVLEYLMRHKDTVVTKHDMLQNVWDAHYSGPDNVVEVYIGYVRRKIDTPFGTNTIRTIRGVGYRLDSGEAVTGT